MLPKFQKSARIRTCACVNQRSAPPQDLPLASHLLELERCCLLRWSTGVPVGRAQFSCSVKKSCVSRAKAARVLSPKWHGPSGCRRWWGWPWRWRRWGLAGDTAAQRARWLRGRAGKALNLWCQRCAAGRFSAHLQCEDVRGAASRPGSGRAACGEV